MDHRICIDSGEHIPQQRCETCDAWERINGMGYCKVLDVKTWPGDGSECEEWRQ